MTLDLYRSSFELRSVLQPVYNNFYILATATLPISLAGRPIILDAVAREVYYWPDFPRVPVCLS
ncbi:hypothetical protein M405DRAFT_835737 [Rhizopogon salebrosus TDB-379]|nr:hypothetical protein M405DRAFT_835737 [Rhizopogon salebrosus TDB-379]